MTVPKVAAVVPAYDAESTVYEVASALRDAWPWTPPGGAVIVVDDGSTDRTSEEARRAGAHVVRHPRNRGKGAALRTGFHAAAELGADMVVTVDADAQHPPEEAVRLATATAPEHALVLGVRDLVRDGAPRANRFSNGISNFFLSLFTGRTLQDTQCGLRRYPLGPTLALACRDDGYAFEAECILRAAHSDIPIVEVPVRVHYPPEHLRVTHFHVVKDPARIVYRVLATLASRPSAAGG